MESHMRKVLDIVIRDRAGNEVKSQLLKMSEVRFVNAMLKDFPGHCVEVRLIAISKRSFDIEFGNV